MWSALFQLGPASCSDKDNPGPFYVYSKMSSQLFPRAPNSRRRLYTLGAHTLPSNWKPNEHTLSSLACELDASIDEVIALYLTGFLEIAFTRSFMYRNWDTAFRNCVRKDWLGVRHDLH